jgi:hypothetical protein
MSAAARAVAPPLHAGRATAAVGTAPVRAPRPAPPRPRLRVVPPTALPAPRAPFVVLVLCLVVAGLVSLLMLNTMVNENSFRIKALQERQATLDLHEQALQRDIDRREATPALAAAARRLGLVPAGTPAFIELPDGRVLGVPTPALPTTAAKP